jgi:hypothetical protein
MNPIDVICCIIVGGVLSVLAGTVYTAIQSSLDSRIHWAVQVAIDEQERRHACIRAPSRPPKRKVDE